MTAPGRDRRTFLRITAAPAFLLLFAALFFPAPARAMDAVDFPRALERAFRGNPFLAAAGFDYEASREEADAALGRFFPSLTFDHRACTGGEAARFLAALLDDLAQPT